MLLKGMLQHVRKNIDVEETRSLNAPIAEETRILFFRVLRCVDVAVRVN